jgi:hypothetical protein
MPKLPSLRRERLLNFGSVNLVVRRNAAREEESVLDERERR